MVAPLPSDIKSSDILPEAAVHTGLLTNKRIIRIFEGLEKFAYRSATKISVISDGFVDNLVGKGVQENKIVLIPNWVDVNFIQPLPKEESPFRKAHQLNGKFVVLYSGNIGRTQPLTALIDAAARLKHIPEIAVVIVGEEKALQDLELYRQKIDATNVLLLPFQPRKELPQMLAAADIGMVMQKENVISFNMPSKIQVLLASGRPIIASVPSTGTAAKAVQQSKGGIVVPPEDSEALAAAILDLYKNPDKAEALGKQGRQYAIENYAFNTALDRYEKLFGEVSLH
jgi:colanic acid biosynthesis glycosyl transferase WcaI